MASATGQSKKRLALAIIDYLNTSVSDGSIASEEAESIEIATNCIAEAFKVDPSDEVATKDALGGQSLLSIYSVYEKLKGKTTASTAGSSSAAEARPATPATPNGPAAGALDDKTKAEAEKFKGQGNAAIQKKDYAAAIDLYTKALDLNPLHPIYLSNRAAAYSGAGKHEEAKNDAEMAVAADPTFAKAWSRLGLAKFALGDAKGSMDAYKKGIDAEGQGGSAAMRKGYETAKQKVEEENDDSADDDAIGARDGGNPFGGGAGGMPDLSSLAGMFGGGAGGAGGMPGGMGGLAEMMKNPMMAKMAQDLMSNPEQMAALMNNPMLKGMMGGGGGAGGAGGGGGGMPDMSALMNDPNIADMAKKFMGGGAGGAGRGSGA
ncbi:small glutamine-rich tetratricopeptide repeat-containing protein-like protein [Venturia nashicola]|nr:small glutamine-rich tetratricopeptide repeat-containing protein-like protein [Venturia nashicola]